MALTDTQINELIHAHRKRAETENTTFDKYRAFYRSEYWSSQGAEAQNVLGSGDDREGTPVTEVNYAYAYVDTMVASVVPPNPAVTILPKKESLRNQAKRREMLINDLFDRTEIVEQLWEAATLSGVCGRSFFKAFWSERHNRPEFSVVDPKFVWFDREAKKWDDVRYVAQVTVKTKEEFESIVKEQLEACAGELQNLEMKEGEIEKDMAEDLMEEMPQVDAVSVDIKSSEETRILEKIRKLEDILERTDYNAYPKWLADKTQAGNYMSDTAREVFKWVVVYEFYDFVGDGRFHMIVDGQPTPFYSEELPYRHLKNPFRLLTFNSNLEDVAGMSDVKLIAPMLEELNEVESLRLWFMKSSIPVMTLNKGICDNSADVKSAYETLNVGDLLEIEGRQSAPIEHIIGMMRTPSLSPDFANVTNRLESSIEQTLGLSKYSRGGVGNTDVATEVALADAANRTRNGRRQKKIYSALSWMTTSAMRLWEENLSDDDLLMVRVDELAPYEEINRDGMGMVGVEEVDHMESVEMYAYDAVPYSAADNNRVVQLQQMQQWMAPLTGNPAIAPFVDGAKLARRMLELLEVPEVFTQPPPQPMVPGGAPGLGSPPGVEEGPPPGGLAGAEAPLQEAPEGLPILDGSSPAI